MIEVAIGASLLSIAIFTAFSFFRVLIPLDARTESTIRSDYLLLEAVDVVKIFRDTSWTTHIASLTTGTPYYLIWDSGDWEATTTVSVIDGVYYRTVQLDPVLRDASDDISTSGTTDAGTLKLTAEVSWLTREGTTTRAVEAYVFDIYAN